MDSYDTAKNATEITVKLFSISFSPPSSIDPYGDIETEELYPRAFINSRQVSVSKTTVEHCEELRLTTVSTRVMFSCTHKH